MFCLIWRFLEDAFYFLSTVLRNLIWGIIQFERNRREKSLLEKSRMRWRASTENLWIWTLYVITNMTMDHKYVLGTVLWRTLKINQCIKSLSHWVLTIGDFIIEIIHQSWVHLKNVDDWVKWLYFSECVTVTMNWKHNRAWKFGLYKTIHSKLYCICDGHVSKQKKNWSRSAASNFSCL